MPESIEAAEFRKELLDQNVLTLSKYIGAVESRNLQAVIPGVRQTDLPSGQSHNPYIYQERGRGGIVLASDMSPNHPSIYGKKELTLHNNDPTDYYQNDLVEAITGKKVVGTIINYEAGSDGSYPESQFVIVRGENRLLSALHLPADLAGNDKEKHTLLETFATKQQNPDAKSHIPDSVILRAFQGDIRPASFEEVLALSKKIDKLSSSYRERVDALRNHLELEEQRSTFRGRMKLRLAALASKFTFGKD